MLFQKKLPKSAIKSTFIPINQVQSKLLDFQTILPIQVNHILNKDLPKKFYKQAGNPVRL